MASFFLFLRDRPTLTIVAFGLCVLMLVAKGFFPFLITFVITGAVLYGGYRLFG